MESGWVKVLGVFVAIATVIHAVTYLAKLIRWIRNRKALERTRDRQGYLAGVCYSLLCALLWSLSYVTLSYVSPKADPLDTNVILLGSGCAFLLIAWGIASLLDKNKQNSDSQLNVQWRTTAPWIVVASNLASFLLFIYALYFISASQTITLLKINPLFVAIIARVWCSEQLSRSTLSAVVVVIIGTMLILANDQFSLEGSANVTGSIIAIAAGVAFAFFSVGLDVVGESQAVLRQRLRFMATVFFLSYIGIISLAYFQHRVIKYDLQVILILLLNGLRVALVYALYYAAVRRIGPLLASVIVALEVPFTIFWDWRLMHHIAGLRLIVGAVAIVLGGLTLGWDKWRDGSAKTAA